MVQAIVKTSFQQIHSYTQLRKTVAQTFFESQQKIEVLRVQTYWQTGRLLGDYLKTHPKERVGRKSVLRRLAEDLNMECSLFIRMHQFARLYPSGVSGHHLSWTHYRALMTISNAKLRGQLRVKIGVYCSCAMKLQNVHRANKKETHSTSRF